MNPNTYEKNPTPLPLLFLIKFALIYYVFHNREEWDNDEDSKGVRALATIISCAPVPGNIKASKYNGG